MKKAWRVIIIIVLVAVLLGVVAAAVGLMTGAELNRIYSVFDNKYHIEEYVQWFNLLLQEVESAFGL